ncbi:hypothetical protein PR048_031126 [Dryococelus australis]|uniref:CHK kinase-like domain-containing protein n=1 Tax=Dryococelus australis TaxID=614101 RepID=A0ABQ9G4E6_9NEOP|nr:hypothetical protein PR048_031126 [Dryococelus australis]
MENPCTDMLTVSHIRKSVRELSLPRIAVTCVPTVSAPVQVMSGGPLPELTKDDLEQLLQAKVDSFAVSRLTAPGENYGSTMLKVDVTLLPDRRKVFAVAKMVSEFPHMREFFHYRETVPKEIYVYVHVRPEFQTIQKEYRVPERLFLDVIPKCYGARTTLGGGIDEPVDESSVILLENLRVSGYRLVDRIVGMDLKHLEYAVIHLARFHSTAIVLKLKKPGVFKETVMKATAFVRGGPPPGDEGTPGPLALLKSLSHLPVFQQYKDKIKAAMDMDDELMQMEEPPKAREPFATFLHNDFWTNNMMFSYGGINDEEITGVKIFDFQMTLYGSPITDLLFLLYSSRTLDVTKEDCDRLIKLYHKEFIKWLELFGCDTEPFSYENFLKEIEMEASKCFSHAFIMLRISSVPESNAPDLSIKSDADKIFRDNTGLGKTYFMKVEKLIKEFVDRQWI